MKLNNHINKKVLMTISKILANLYKDGISINESLVVLEDSIYDKRYKNSISKVNIYTKEGKSLSESFEMFPELYPSFFTGFINIGESTGKLYESLNGLGTFYEKYIKISNKIKEAVSYPCFVFTSFIFMIIVFSTNIIPIFVDMYKGVNIEVPGVSMFLFNIINTFKEDLLSSVIMVLSILGFLIFMIVSLLKKINFIFFKNLKIVREALEYMTILIFSIICSTGINISYALNYCIDSIKPTYLNNKIKQINEYLIKGQTLSESLERSDLLSKYSLALVKAREQSGSIEEGFKELEKKLEYELDVKINRYVSRINPICIISIAVFVVIFMLTTLVPLFDNLTSGLML